jgi:hypothetical protein
MWIRKAARDIQQEFLWFNVTLFVGEGNDEIFSLLDERFIENWC